jgi:hypothetical protein
MSQEMNMRRATDIMTWEKGLKLGNAIFISWLDATAKGLVDVGLVGKVSVSLIVHAAVNTSCVAVPDLEIQLWHRFTSSYVDDLVVENKVNALLVLLQIASDRLATDVLSLLAGVILIAEQHSQYGPRVTSGVSTHEFWPAKRVSAGVLGV